MCVGVSVGAWVCLCVGMCGVYGWVCICVWVCVDIMYVCQYVWVGAYVCGLCMCVLWMCVCVGVYCTHFICKHTKTACQMPVDLKSFAFEIFPIVRLSVLS